MPNRSDRYYTEAYYNISSGRLIIWTFVEQVQIHLKGTFCNKRVCSAYLNTVTPT